MGTSEVDEPAKGAELVIEDSAAARQDTPARGAELVIEDSVAAQQADEVASYVPLERPPSVLRGIVGGLGGAMIGAAIWWGLIRMTGYELGLVAIGVGVLAGLGVVKFGGRGATMQIIGGLCAVLGITLGKTVYYYVGFDENVAQALMKETGVSLEEAKVAIQMARDAGVIDLGTYLKESMTAMSVIMIAFGLFEGWRIPRSQA